MATFAIGDVHGCWESLQRLLDRLPFDRERDRLWMVGDLVNRGPRSLEVLRWAREIAAAMGGRFAVVLGNHDLRLLALAAGLSRAKRLDTLGPVLAAEDGAELVAWLGSRPMLHRDGSPGREPGGADAAVGTGSPSDGGGGWILVHAGLLPRWTVDDAEAAAREVERALADSRRDALLTRPHPDEDDSDLRPLREALSAFTRLRTLTADGRHCGHSGPIEETPAGCIPWFRMPGRRTAGTRIVCGHWSALGLYREGGVVALDTGCVWGRGLTAMRLDDGELFRQPTVERPEELPGG